MKLSFWLTFSVVVICLVSNVSGAGFSIFEQGAEAMGMAGAFTARADNPSAIFFNPAGITQLEGTQVSAGLTVIAPDVTLTDPYGKEWDLDDQIFIPPNLYVTQEINSRFNIGFGMGTQFGLGMKWNNNEDFIYRYLIEDVDLKAIYFNPVVAYQINDIFSVGGGLFYVISDVTYRAAVDMSPVAAALSAALGTEITLPDGFMSLDADNGSGDYGFNLGLQTKLDKWRLGLTYRSEVECNYDGSADFKLTPSGYGPEIDAIVAGYFPNAGGKTTITMPASASLGVAYLFSDKLSLEFDLNWMGWSSYDKLDIDFASESLPDKSQPKDWDDVFSYRLGAKLQATDALELYAGYYFDESPIPDETLDPILPCADRHSVQIGAGYTVGNFKIEAAYQALFFEDRGTDSNILGVNGDYESFSHLFGMQLSYRI